MTNHADDSQDFWKRLRDEGLLSVSPAEGSSLVSACQEIERHATHFAGDLILLQIDEGFAIVEQPSDEEWVIRHLKTREAANEFIAKRIAQYDRMWDGCGCKIDYRS